MTNRRTDACLCACVCVVCILSKSNPQINYEYRTRWQTLAIRHKLEKPDTTERQQQKVPLTWRWNCMQCPEQSSTSCWPRSVYLLQPPATVHKTITVTTRMWANAQGDGCPAKYRWRPLFNAAKFGWRPLLECHAVTLPRRQTHWNLQGCPKLTKRSQPLVGRSSPYYGDMWRRYCCLTSFFRLSMHALFAKI